MLPDIPCPRRVCVTVLTGFLLFLISTPSLTAQGTGELMGTVTDRTGAPLAFAMVRTTSVDTGLMLPAATGVDGTYRFKLPPGSYRLSFEYPGYRVVEISDATIRGPWRVVQNCTLEADSQTQGNSTAEPAQKPAPSPSNNPQEPSLEDLGITPAQAKGNAQAQALLDKRSHMLKIHQRLGLITIEPFAATLISFRRSLAEGRPAAPPVTCMPLWVRRRWDCISRRLTLPSARPRYPAPRRAGPSACTRPWPGFTVRGWS